MLILGGIDEQERLVDVVEKFDVGSGRSETVPLTWHSRSGHTATLLDSTRVLVAGGAIDGRPASDIEIINMADWHAVSLASLERARRGHAAALLADGRVELVGGEGTEGPLGELRTVINVAKRVVRPITTTHADSSTVTTTYDAGNRPTQVDDSVGGTITRQYDLSDRLTSETTPEGTISYTYDALDR
ncbi:MAG TPA: RHS repeat domain-containing protein, partial [Vicinamibacterales bacterium]|nr:RHS repeat domain-containing protein [Vicinamibacterales bacterium]